MILNAVAVQIVVIYNSLEHGIYWARLKEGAPDWYNHFS
jgi:hypothetical protein